MVIALLALLVVSAMAYNEEAKPWTFWNWKYGSVSRPGIHADLTGMKNVGMGGIWLMPVREAGERLEFQDGVAQLSPEFWKMMDYSFQLADSLDFDMGIHVLPGNPLVLPAESMQKVVWTDTIVKGGKKIEGLQMWQPESYKDGKMQSAGSEGGYYQDIAAFAIRFKGKTGPAWRNATDSAARSEAVPMTDVLPLKMEGGMVMGVMVNGILQNKLPKGSWCLLRMGHTSTGQTHATDGKGMGLEVDRFSPAAVKKLFNSWYAPLLNRPHGDVVSYLYIDPREWGSQNWGCQFAEEFKVRRGYDLIPYLPVMAGVPLESASRYEQVQNDIRLTIEELVKEKFFQTLTRLAEEQYVEVSCEPIPRTDNSDDMFHAVSRAHIYNEIRFRLRFVQETLVHGTGRLPCSNLWLTATWRLASTGSSSSTISSDIQRREASWITLLCVRIICSRVDRWWISLCFILRETPNRRTATVPLVATNMI